jgi:hypothetical protein
MHWKKKGAFECLFANKEGKNRLCLKEVVMESAQTFEIYLYVRKE